MRTAFIETLCELAEQNERIWLLTRLLRQAGVTRECSASAEMRLLPSACKQHEPRERESWFRVARAVRARVARDDRVRQACG